MSVSESTSAYMTWIVCVSVALSGCSGLLVTYEVPSRYMCEYMQALI